MGKENPGNAVNLLCEGTVIVGDIKTKNDIRIDGIIKGKIITSGRQHRLLQCRRIGGCTW